MVRAANARLFFVALALGTIALGLTVSRAGAALQPAARDILGDALWAAMMYWWIGAVSPSAPLIRRAAIALAVSWTVELSQSIHTLQLDRLRETTIGHLVLGSDFDPRDLAAYVAGVGAAVLLELVFRRRSVK